jgi:GT2 family glycosyltransferase
VSPAEAVAIVVNHNGLGLVEEAVQSLVEQDQPGLEVLLVDNGSSDGSPEAVERRFRDRVRVLRAPRNLGFGGGNNLGIRESAGRHVILLNSDAIAAPGFARELVLAADSSPDVGMVAAKVLEHDRRDVIDTVGHLIYADGLNRGRGRLELDSGQYDSDSEALFPSGAAALYRRAMIEEIGGFDESFFLYGEDADLGLRGRRAGWRCLLAPRAVAYHRYSQTAGAYSSLKAFHVERNRVWVLLKHFPLGAVLRSPAYTGARLALQAWGGATGRGAAGRLAAERSTLHLVGIVVRAYAAALRGAPRVLRERRRTRHLRRLGTRAFNDLLREHRLSLRDVALKD